MKSILENIIRSEVDSIVDKLMSKFEEEIIPYEDNEDPARPSLCRDEFRIFLKETIEENLSINEDLGHIKIGIGDTKKLGFDEELNPDTTDCLKIIGTILQGISGKYVLVVKQMTGDSEGRFGSAFLVPEDQYRSEAVSKGWDPNKAVWKFSNFPGLPDFFEVDISDIIDRITKKIGEAIVK
jgi:hypothetical protein